MPASTDNPNILQAGNQIVQALLDMISEGFPIALPEGAIQVNVTNNITSGSGGCGGCSGGTGRVTDNTPSDGQPDEGGSGPGGYPDPPGWDEEAQGPYSHYKCKAAMFIYDSIKLTLNYLGGLTTAAGAIAAGEALGAWLLASVAAFSPIGVVGVSIFAVLTGWEVALIIGLVAAASIIAGAAILAAFSATATELEEHREDIICALLNARTPEAARDAVGPILADVAALAAIDPPLDAFESTARELIGSVLGYFLPNTLLNKLFTEDDAVNSYNPETVDCSFCGGCEGAEWSITYGTIIDGTPTSTTVTIESVAGPDVAGTARYWMTFGYTCDQCFRLSISSSGFTHGDLGANVIGDLVYKCSDGGAYDLQFDVPPETWDGECFFPASSGGFQFNSRTPFTVTLTVTEAPCE